MQQMGSLRLSLDTTLAIQATVRAHLRAFLASRFAWLHLSQLYSSMPACKWHEWSPDIL